MAAGKAKQPDVYNSIFDFIFSVQKKGRNKPFPKKVDGLSNYASSLIEIGTQPTIYPIESAFAGINAAVDSATEIDLGFGIKGGLGSGVFANPIAYSKKEIAKNRANAKWASIGGSLHRGIDSALVSLYARRNGASGKIARKAGSIYNQLIEDKMYEGYKHSTQRAMDKRGNSLGEKSLVRNDKTLPYRTEEDVKMKKNRLLNEAIDLRMEAISIHHPGVSTKDLKTIVTKLQSEDDKKERIRRTVTTLQSTGLDAKERLTISHLLWGDLKNKNDNGVYILQEGTLDKEMKEIKNEFNLSQDAINTLKRIKKENKSQKEKQRELYKELITRQGFEKQEAFDLTNRIQKIETIEKNDSDDIVKDSLYFSLAMDTVENLKRKGSYEEIVTVKDHLKNVLQPKNRATAGMRVERALMVSRWISNSGKWDSILLSGAWQKFGSQDVNFTNIVKQEIAKDENRNDMNEKYFTAADSIIGKTLGKFYYWHPNNFIRGAFISGELWIKREMDKKGYVDKKSVNYFMSQIALGRQLAILTKPITGLSNNIVKLIKPMFEGTQKFVKNLLTKAIGATGVGAVIVNFIMSGVTDKLAEIMNQIVILLVLGVLGILFIIFGAISTAYYSDEDWAQIFDKRISAESNLEQGNIFTDDDFCGASD